MKKSTKEILKKTILDNPIIKINEDEILQAFKVLVKTFKSSHKILLCGNGGSASDCEHIVGELLKKFKKYRAINSSLANRLALNNDEDSQMLLSSLEGGLKAISLTSHLAFNTAFINDNNSLINYAQQCSILGDTKDTLICISTSGNSKNCVYAAVVAKAKSMNVIAFTGKNESKLSSLSDVAIKVGSTETYRIQEFHIVVYHCLCAMLEEELFD